LSKAYNVVRDFEQALSEYTGAPYVVAVESCSAALFLCCKYVQVDKYDHVLIPKHTYPSVANAVVNAGGNIVFDDENWQGKGWYALVMTSNVDNYDIAPIIDSAKHLKRNMYKYFGDFRPLVCLSFHGKKCLKIGRGGAILTDNKEAYEWLKYMRFDGRHEAPLKDDKLMGAGWNMYMTPSQAARGLEFMQWLPDENIEEPDEYQDLSQYEFYTKANR